MSDTVKSTDEKSYAAHELLDIAFDWLRQRHPEAVIVAEFSVGEWGKALVDVAAICKDRIVGVEIKGAGDSATRLPLQGAMYSRVCREMFLLCTPELIASCSKKLPHGWSMLNIWDHPGHATRLGFDQQPDHGKGYGLSSVALAAMPWTKEYRRFGSALGIGAPSRKEACIKAVAETCPVTEIESAVCQVLRMRREYRTRVSWPAEEHLAPGTLKAKSGILL